MNVFSSALLKIAGSAAALAAFSGPALAQDRDYGREGYDQRYEGNNRWGDDRRDHNRLHGPGVRYLIPALRDTWQGRQFVIRQSGPNGRLSEREARQINYRFIRIADRNRDGRVSDREARRALEGRGDRDHRDGDRHGWVGR